MANAAPAIDANGDIYVVTGNGPYNPQFGLDQLGESIVHLVWNPGNPGSLTVADWFTPFVDSSRDDGHRDQDLASGGIIVFPDEMGLIAGGKDGAYYHVNRANMGKRDFTKLLDSPFVASFDYQPTNGHTSLFDDLNQVTSTDPFTIGPPRAAVQRISMGRACTSTTCIFVQGENNKVRVFSKSSGHISAQPVAQGTSIASFGTSSPGGMPGGILALSANGTSNAILWANEAFGNLPNDPDANLHSTPNILRAYDVSTVPSGTLQEIWDSEAEPNDRVGTPPNLLRHWWRMARYIRRPTTTRSWSTASETLGDADPGHSADGGIHLRTDNSRPGHVCPRGHQRWRADSHPSSQLVEPAHQYVSLGRRESRLGGSRARPDCAARQVRRRIASGLDDKPGAGHRPAVRVDRGVWNRGREHIRLELLDAGCGHGLRAGVR